MSNPNYAIFWTTNAKLDLKDIYLSLKQNISPLVATKITNEIFGSLNSIIFPDQFQIDDYRIDCRRIIIRIYKILYQLHDNTIYVVRIFNTFQDPIKSLK
ncbi:type II toxin-antitoxin system RelE/ParE family toxin [Flavobacterium sinopsychrotolerans]|jgi:plasmid stabilization system protein ParE|uniref:Plasmid stabilization system protein ParE n=1 Tax=Flavobacterium sinopsychrotolerans TaxID=604089 RepID=A0A1H8IG88_9FLAO|nr:type II toxin-antitoxin system RelE/ParE family toxin [Flavobacterium sinopsychrotolerans]SEN67289.1 Plasmid stabilization system protein ParE [Flavobacterium sinopsychrotolerans]